MHAKMLPFSPMQLAVNASTFDCVGTFSQHGFGVRAVVRFDRIDHFHDANMFNVSYEYFVVNDETIVRLGSRHGSAVRCKAAFLLGKIRLSGSLKAS